MTQAAQVPCFRNIAAHLEPGGFVIKVMIPDLRTRLKASRREANDSGLFSSLATVHQSISIFAGLR
jgi:hypothetical protein